MAFLPVTTEDMNARGWDRPDFVLVTGDAYVDHSSFGTAIISRLLESLGYRVAILSQPDWRSCDDFTRFGRPRLAFLVNSGNVDSMVNHYSVFRRRRRQDFYSPGGESGHRPDRAVIVYCNRIREAYGKNMPVIIGGIEASLRRLGHYDYWDDRVRHSILVDSQADLLMYGMGEHAVAEIAEALDSGIEVKDITWIRGTVFADRSGRFEEDNAWDDRLLILPSFTEISESKEKYAESFLLQYRNTDYITGKRLAEAYGGNVVVVQNPPAEPLTTRELDDIYELPYERDFHPAYRESGGVPAIREVKFSLTSVRGCFGECSFCALTFHQGRRIQARSKESLLREAQILIADPEFKGYIHDVGGPTANFRRPACRKQKTRGVCTHRDCMFPSPCPNLEVDHSEYIDILRELRSLPGVKKVFIRSGIRFDYLLADRSRAFLRELCRHHVSGELKVAPEHVSDNVLRRMHKPPVRVFERFVREFTEENRKAGKRQYMIPYFISSHPGSTLEDACELSVFLNEHGFVPDQVQDFYPTPGTLSTCMYYTGIDPVAGEKVYTARDPEEKQMQRAMLHFNRQENAPLVRKALRQIHRENLIGYGRECLVPPEKNSGSGRNRAEKPGTERRSGKERRQKSSRTEGRDRRTSGKRPEAGKRNRNRNREGRRPSEGNRTGKTKTGGRPGRGKGNPAVKRSR
ncbi:MAG: YgiQ family radical SAM protein [Firmicutes bacterium]|nr:YgiQ family radical SAM protein [Bacillota bacterium]